MGVFVEVSLLFFYGVGFDVIVFVVSCLDIEFDVDVIYFWDVLFGLWIVFLLYFVGGDFFI